MAGIEEYGLSRPFANMYTWVSGTVAVDKETYSNVGVRKNGFLGSQSDTRPSLKLRLDKYVDDQSLCGVIERDGPVTTSIVTSSMVSPPGTGAGVGVPPSGISVDAEGGGSHAIGGRQVHIWGRL